MGDPSQAWNSLDHDQRIVGCGINQGRGRARGEATLKGDGSPVSKAGWEHEPIGKHRGYWRQTKCGGNIGAEDTLRMIPQTRIFSQLDDDKDEDEDYNEMIQEEDEEQRRKEGPEDEGWSAEATNVKQELSDLSTGLTTDGMGTGCRRRAQPEHLGRGPLPMALIPEHQSSRGPTETEGWDGKGSNQG
ncbi:hypothetical protein BY996DRAFT_6414018 [Phakopsora pachyrhizi]|nr:hypothetical protein BY996DRAFT_6414018 [Phakopsora pachyrhizi]